MPRVAIDSVPVERCHIRGGKDDVLRGFSSGDFEFWGDDPYGAARSDSWVLVSAYRKPMGGMTRILLDSGFGDFGNGGLNWTPLFETRVGAGLCLACQLRLTEKATTHPSALALLERLLTYAAEWQPRERTPVEAVGERPRLFLENLGAGISNAGDARVVVASAGEAPEETARGLASRAEGGATVLVTGITRETEPVVARAFGIELDCVDLGTQYNLVRRRSDPTLEGVSNQETYWLDKGQYCPPESMNHPITDTLLACPEGEEILSSEHDSCWREFITQGANSERLRMPVITHYLWSGPRASASGLVRVRRGKGELILCQVPFPEDGYAKAVIFWIQLLGNLGVEMERALFEGESVPAGSRRSDGFPTRMKHIVDPSPQLLDEVLQRAMPGEYRLPDDGLYGGFPWLDAETPDGALAGAAKGGLVLIAFQVNAGRPRSAEPVEGGLPDPSQQTLLDVRGCGTAVVRVNGRDCEAVDLRGGGQATVPDIDLNKDWNTVIVRWRPEAEDGTIAFAWRNRQGQAEVEFEFA
jgi:hypothetical protein